MPKFIIIEEHPDFGSASRRAKALAVRFRERTGIQRSSRGWAVLASSAVLSALVPLGTEQRNKGTPTYLHLFSKGVSSNGATRVGTGQGSMRATKFQGTAGYVTRMSGAVGESGRGVSSYPD